MVAQDILGREINTGREDVANHERITQIEKLRYANDGKQYGIYFFKIKTICNVWHNNTNKSNRAMRYLL